MSNEHAYTVVVGIDGSTASRDALRWAVWHAEQVDGRITTLMAWDYPMIYNWEAPASQDVASETATALRTVIEEVAGDTSVPIRREVAQGHPARALLDTATESRADLLVVGNRGHGGLTEALLGSVSQHCVHHAPCPVVVVRKQR